MVNDELAKVPVSYEKIQRTAFVHRVLRLWIARWNQHPSFFLLLELEFLQTQYQGIECNRAARG